MTLDMRKRDSFGMWRRLGSILSYHSVRLGRQFLEARPSIARLPTLWSYSNTNASCGAANRPCTPSTCTSTMTSTAAGEIATNAVRPVDHDAASIDEKLEPSLKGSAEASSPPPRPAIDWSSPSAFFSSFGARWRSVWTRRFVFSLLAGQLVSLCITCTNVTTTELVKRGWTLSTSQGFFL